MVLGLTVLGLFGGLEILSPCHSLPPSSPSFFPGRDCILLLWARPKRKASKLLCWEWRQTSPFSVGLLASCWRKERTMLWGSKALLTPPEGPSPPLSGVAFVSPKASTSWVIIRCTREVCGFPMPRADSWPSLRKYSSKSPGLGPETEESFGGFSLLATVTTARSLHIPGPPFGIFINASSNVPESAISISVSQTSLCPQITWVGGGFRALHAKYAKPEG